MSPRLSAGPDVLEMNDWPEAPELRPVLNPCVLVGLGPTATAAVQAAQQRMHVQVQGEPPFHAVLTLERLAPHPVCRLQVGGETVAPDDASEATPAAQWLEFALSRVTEIWRNLEHNVWRGSRNAFERIELIVVAALDEVEAFDSQLQMLRDVSSRFPGCWRLGLFWTTPLGRALPEAPEAAGRAIAERIAAIDRQQAGVDAQAPRPLFDATFLLGAPVTPGLHTLRPADVIDLTAAFLGYTTASNYALDLRQFLQPQGGPWQYHFGLLVRRYRPKELLGALNRLWLREALAILDAPPPAPVSSNTDAKALSVTALRGGTREQIEAEITGYVEAVRGEASHWPAGSPKAPAGNGSPPPRSNNGQHRAGRRLEGLLPRAEAIFQEHLQTILKLCNSWHRERDDVHHRFEQWKLGQAAEAAGEHRGKTRAGRLRWAYLLFLLPIASLLWIAWVSGSTAFQAVALALTALGLAGIVHRIARGSASRRAAPPPGSEPAAEEGRELERQFKLATAMVVDPEARAEALGDASPPQPGGLWRAACELGEWHRQLTRLRHRLREDAFAGEDADPWFVRNIISRRDLDVVFSRALAAAYEQRTTDREKANLTAGWRHEIVSRLLHEALEPQGLGFGQKPGPEDAFDALVQVGNKLVAHCEHLTLPELLSLAGRGHPSGLDGPSVFFNTLARGAVVLWNPGPDDANGELTRLLHSAPWDPELAQRGAASIGHCETSPENVPGEIALIRVVRGKRWPGVPSRNPADWLREPQALLPANEAQTPSALIGPG